MLQILFDKFQVIFILLILRYQNVGYQPQSHMRELICLIQRKFTDWRFV